MTISQLEAKLERLNTRVGAAQAELTRLRTARKETKIQLAEAKKAAKHGKLPAREPEGLTEKITTILNESVAEPIAEMLGLAEPAPVTAVSRPVRRKVSARLPR